MREDSIMSMTTEPRADATLLRQTLRFAAIAALLGGLFGLAPLGLDVAKGAETTHLQVSKGAYGATQPISLGINKSLIVDLPANVGEVIVSQPEVAAAVMRSKNRAIIQGVAAGDTNIFFLDPSGRTISVLDIEVFQPRSDVGSSLEASLARIIPGSAIRVESVTLNGATNRIVLSGTVGSQDDEQRAIDIAVQFAGDPANVASVIDVSGAQQVMLKVTIAEVNREAVKQLGINLNGTATLGSVTLGLQNNPALGGASNVITSNGGSAGVAVPGFSLQATLRALERRSALRTLAEPNLTAMSGQEAEFLAGGEFPVPTEVADDGTVTYTFKEFGVRLKFTPTVKSNGIIGLIVDTKVSEPTTEGGFSVGGVTIQATKERQARTSVELAAGQTLAIAGLIQDSVRQQINKLPGLGDIPILGALFRSRDFIHAQTELVILVTPFLAFPGDAPALPTDGMVVAGDAEAIFLGHMEKMYGVGPDGMRGSYDGSVGFVLD
ncbi:MAG: type II and III secretion system protein family protein [Devosia sp.]